MELTDLKGENLIIGQERVHKPEIGFRDKHRSALT